MWPAGEEAPAETFKSGLAHNHRLAHGRIFEVFEVLTNVPRNFAFRSSDHASFAPDSGYHADFGGGAHVWNYSIILEVYIII